MPSSPFTSQAKIAMSPEPGDVYFRMARLPSTREAGSMARWRMCNRISEYIFTRLQPHWHPTHFIRRLNMREQRSCARLKSCRSRYCPQRRGRIDLHPAQALEENHFPTLIRIAGMTHWADPLIGEKVHRLFRLGIEREMQEPARRVNDFSCRECLPRSTFS
jgi:hypothetical protein